MPRTPDLSSYGPEYEQLLLRVGNSLNGTDEFAVQFADNNTANSIRTRTYGYFKALRSSSTRPDLCAICSGIGMRVAGSALVFFRRENSADAVALRKALGLADGFSNGNQSMGVIAPDSGLSSNMEKLKQIRERKKT